MVLATLLAVVALITVALVWSMRRTASRIETDPLNGLDADARSLYIPIRRTLAEIESTVDTGSSTTIQILGSEAKAESVRISEQVLRALRVRSELRRASRGKSMAEAELTALQGQIDASASDAERAALESARGARQLEVGHYQSAAATIGSIDAGIRQASAALSEMETRLKLSVGREKAEAGTESDLRETLGRMRALSVSYDEAEATLGKL